MGAYDYRAIFDFRKRNEETHTPEVLQILKSGFSDIGTFTIKNNTLGHQLILFDDGRHIVEIDFFESTHKLSVRLSFALCSYLSIVKIFKKFVICLAGLKDVDIYLKESGRWSGNVSSLVNQVQNEILDCIEKNKALFFGIRGHYSVKDAVDLITEKWDQAGQLIDENPFSD